VSETVSVGVFVGRVESLENFDEPRGESTAYSPKLVEDVFSVLRLDAVSRKLGCVAYGVRPLLHL
jgi:hypothetical protein